MFKNTSPLTMFFLTVIMIGMGVYLHVQARQYDTGAETLQAAVPDFSWTDFDGKTQNIKALKGRKVVIHFWASWCGPCRTEFPSLLAEARQDKDTTFLTISGDDTLESARKFVQQAQAAAGAQALPNVIYAFDPDKKISFDIFQTAVYPESILVDKTQQMRHKFPGAVVWKSTQVQDALKTLE